MRDTLEFISYLGGLVIGLIFLFVLVGTIGALAVAFTYKALFERRRKHDITPEDVWLERYRDEIS